ncbi:hypothetical protein B739_1794 [Riemerella anatipestifer RA-CH-1]|uniref:Uncharacterized protein n=3 Tax=Riemerella anatipestifer TaxID=34085 RepID=J9R7B6_RIEAN|nr:hypothetical protein B739_1794 [Riemerella anatipestifer RA-CH-1]AIH03337.1 hypothetical protein M949_2171 [Riemerella anatipestifer CH3]AQY22855.1 hypothetical protein AB406_1914 [Riemerella anatipestifer]
MWERVGVGLGKRGRGSGVACGGDARRCGMVERSGTDEAP